MLDATARAAGRTMRSDIDRWDEKYARGNPNPGFEPDPVLVAHHHLLGPRPGRGPEWALDLACGVGNNALWLAARGFEVLGLDASAVGLAMARARARADGLRVDLVAADLEHYPLPACSFDLVVVVKYLHRPLLPAIRGSLRAGGRLFYRTFNRRHLDAHPRFRKDWVLRDGELGRAFSDLRCLASSEGQPTRDTLSYWIGEL